LIFLAPCLSLALALGFAVAFAWSFALVFASSFALAPASAFLAFASRFALAFDLRLALASSLALGLASRLALGLAARFALSVTSGFGLASRFAAARPIGLTLRLTFGFAFGAALASGFRAGDVDEGRAAGSSSTAVGAVRGEDAGGTTSMDVGEPEPAAGVVPSSAVGTGRGPGARAEGGVGWRRTCGCDLGLVTTATVLPASGAVPTGPRAALAPDPPIETRITVPAADVGLGPRSAEPTSGVAARLLARRGARPVSTNAGTRLASGWPPNAGRGGRGKP
jgi:hypothetical protein